MLSCTGSRSVPQGAAHGFAGLIIVVSFVAAKTSERDGGGGEGAPLLRKESDAKTTIAGSTRAKHPL